MIKKAMEFWSVLGNRVVTWIRVNRQKIFRDFQKMGELGLKVMRIAEKREYKNKRTETLEKSRIPAPLPRNRCDRI